MNTIRAEDLKIEKVVGDEPTRYIDRKTLNEESTQKRFYMRGLHKKQGRFSRAVDHIIENEENKEDRDCEEEVENETSCGLIDMSGIDFGNKKPLQDQDNTVCNKEGSSKVPSSMVVDTNNEKNSLIVRWNQSF